MGILVTASTLRKSRPSIVNPSSPSPRNRNGEFEPIVVPKHESLGLSIEKLVISLYAKGMSVSDIEEEMREIYEIELSTSAISIITNKVSQAALEWQNRPLDPVYLIVWMDGIVFKIRNNGKIINKTVYLCVGLKQNGLKEVLSMWGGKTDSSAFRMGVLTDLKRVAYKRYPHHLYGQPEWIYRYHTKCIPSILHTNMRGTSNQKLL